MEYIIILMWSAFCFFSGAYFGASVEGRKTKQALEVTVAAYDSLLKKYSEYLEDEIRKTDDWLKDYAKREGEDQ